MCWWFWMNIKTMWKHLMCWIKGCSNCKWLIRRLCQTGVSTSLDTYKYWQHPSQTTFLQIVRWNWRGITFMVDFPNDWRQWWPTLRQDLRWEHIQITLGLPGRLKKKIQSSCLRVPGSTQQTVHPNQGTLASFPWGNWRVFNHLLMTLPISYLDKSS